VIAQYYNFVRLGRDGFRRVQRDCRDVATWLAREVGRLGPFKLISHGDELPVFAFRVAGGDRGWTVYDVSERMRARGWQVPAYAMPAGMEDVHVLRIVVRNGFSRDMAALLLADLRAATAALDRSPPGRDSGAPSAFHH
jgi:glutamate decarboxylase